MKKIIILLLTFFSLIACSTFQHGKVNKSTDNNVDSLILQPSTQEPIIHRGHAAHASHASHISHYSSTL